MKRHTMNKKLNIVITGHTRGVGNDLYTHFLDQGHAVDGFSKTVGFDLTIDDWRGNFLHLMKHSDTDVLINNAYMGGVQNSIFKEVFHEWRHDYRTIVNIIDRGVFMKSASDPYIANKKELVAISKKARIQAERKCRVINVYPSTLNHREEYGKDTSVLDTKELASLIDMAINQPHHIEIGDLSVWTIDKPEPKQ